jgi:predicted dehydrogenase
MKIAFAGFRHGHIESLYHAAQKRSDLTVVAACEDDEATRTAIIERSNIPTTIEESRRAELEANQVQLTHYTLDEVLEQVDCDIIAIGDYYSRRGSMAIKALKAGKHVIADKPISTSLEELAEIEQLATANNLKIGCMFDLRDAACYIGVKQLIDNDELGTVQAVSFGGQHPLMIGSRAGWYFEPGKHGGTINDIGIHAIDLIPWLIGSPITEINAARAWNANAAEFPHFKDAAQMMLTLANGCGVLGDVSYLVPDTIGYSHQLYWRMTLWGTKGIAETGYNQDYILLGKNGEKEMHKIALPDGTPGNYIQAFIDDINGTPQTDFNTADVLRSSKISLEIQAEADG